MRKYLQLLCISFSLLCLNSCFPKEEVSTIRSFRYDARYLMMGYGEKSATELTINTAPQLIIDEDYTAGTLKVKLNSLYYPGLGIINLESEPMRYSSSQTSTGEYKVTISMPVAIFGTQTLENFHLTSLGTWVSLSFVYQDLYYVINTSSISRDNTTQAYFVLYDGETTYTSKEGDAFTVDVTKYGLNLNNNGVANLYMYFTKLNGEMDEVNLLYQNLTFTMGKDGYTITSDASVLPKQLVNSETTEAPEYEIANFNAYIPYSGQSGRMSFDWVNQGGSTRVTNVSVSSLTSSDDEE